MIELLPCRFCGSSNIDAGNCYADMEKNWQYVICKDCGSGIQGPADKSDEVISFWNTRAPAGPVEGGGE